MISVSGALEKAGDFRVLVLPEGALMAEALALALRAAGFDVRLAVACPAQGALNVIDAVSPDIALIDLGHGQCLGGRREGEERCATQDPRCVSALLDGLRSRQLSAIVVVDQIALPIVSDVVEMGIGGVVTASEGMEKVMAMIDRRRAAESVMGDAERIELLRQLADGTMQSARAMLSRLTRREREVLLALARGQTPSVIAENTELSVETVRSHIRAIRQKLRVTSQLSAVALVYQAGWLSGPPAER
jgi:DNA-binding NarL/FixJ family response regulator